MRRRSLVLLLSAGALAACSPRHSGTPAAAATPHAAVADDYWWFALERDLDKGFCFTWVQGLTPPQVLKRLGGKELERVTWEQLVGSGDGPSVPADRYFVGVARLESWSLIVEDAGDLGVTDRLVRPLSAGTTAVAHQRGPTGHGRFLLLQDSVVQLDFDPMAPAKLSGTRAAELAPMISSVGFGAGGDPKQSMAAAFALTERLTGTKLTQDLLREHTYVFTSVPRPPT
ncbi:DUF6461 domain-containing protein [Actinoplanes sp. KI2]|uniref:DUF6461 domain-containing protein n=1 Tax=Actinoplanes sp. KI2 TaxID=2983315 RepID=UPI0021D58B7E|nr:DUF6461 domain-containing protein [Actinoplanes sp. KI2]MCU7729795.1 DUF6461 domain-containing protein [Actinoplanes sp. KI2]